VGVCWAGKSLQVNCKPVEQRLRVFHYMSVVKLKINCLLKSLRSPCKVGGFWGYGGAKGGATHLHLRGLQSEVGRSC